MDMHIFTKLLASSSVSNSIKKEISTIAKTADISLLSQMAECIHQYETQNNAVLGAELNTLQEIQHSICRENREMNERQDRKIESKFLDNL